MSKATTNFGPYDREYQARVPRERRLLKGILQVLLMLAAVILAGLFLFPLNAHSGRSGEHATQTAGLAAAPGLSEPAAQVEKE